MIFNDHGTMMLGLEGLKVERYKFLLCVICQVYIYLKIFNFGNYFIVFFVVEGAVWYLGANSGFV